VSAGANWRLRWVFVNVESYESGLVLGEGNYKGASCRAVVAVRQVNGGSRGCSAT
jgi:hypothetical protein